MDEGYGPEWWLVGYRNKLQMDLDDCFWDMDQMVIFAGRYRSGTDPGICWMILYHWKIGPKWCLAGYLNKLLMDLGETWRDNCLWYTDQLKRISWTSGSGSRHFLKDSLPLGDGARSPGLEVTFSWISQQVTSGFGWNLEGRLPVRRLNIFWKSGFNPDPECSITKGSIIVKYEGESGGGWY